MAGDKFYFPDENSQDVERWSLVAQTLATLISTDSAAVDDAITTSSGLPYYVTAVYASWLSADVSVLTSVLNSDISTASMTSAASVR